MDLFTQTVIGTAPAGMTSLPGLLGLLAADRVDAYPAMRAHQEDPWHATLCQIAAYALHRSGLSALPVEPDVWRKILAVCTSAAPFAWHLIAPDVEPAFLQPATDSMKGWDRTSNPAALDALLPIKEHDTSAEEKEFAIRLRSAAIGKGATPLKR